MSRSRNRPHRGSADRVVPGDIRSIVMGDTGDYAPDDEERITAPADLPGGKTHVVNPQTRPVKPRQSTVRPVDEHKQHDVPPMDWATEYDLPEYDITGADERARMQTIKPRGVPEAVPVYIVEHAEEHFPILKMATPETVTVGASTAAQPTRLCTEDRRRVLISLNNQDSTNAVQFGEEQATVIEGRGAILPAASTSYLHLAHQGELWAQSVAATAVKVSVIIQTEVNE
jgi:hypothetical protein